MIKATYTAITFAAVFGRNVGVRLARAAEFLSCCWAEIVILLWCIDESVSRVNFSRKNCKNKDKKLEESNEYTPDALDWTEDSPSLPNGWARPRRKEWARKNK